MMNAEREIHGGEGLVSFGIQLQILTPLREISHNHQFDQWTTDYNRAVSTSGSRIGWPNREC
jgi:hypothetical protein